MTPTILGTKIGQFRFVAEIGRGGMGEVYVGYDEKLEREVALKTLHAERRFDGRAKARFLREARILSQLAHPGICQIFDLLEGETLDVLVLELISGRNLRAVLAEGLEERKKLKIAQELAEVLIAAHAKGVIHRDLKPDNAMLTDEGHVKVLDFGISRATGTGVAARGRRARQPLSEPAGAQETMLLDPAQPNLEYDPRADARNPTLGVPQDGTEVGTILGTLNYMSPEQARGEKLTPLSDIYSLGLIFQELFTGSSPYDDTQNSSFAERLERAQHGQARTVQGLDGGLRNLIERMKSLDPFLRPPATEVAILLAEIEEKPRRKKRRLLVGAALTILVLFSLAMTVQSVRVTRERTRANQEAQAAKLSLAFLKGMFEQVHPSGQQGPTITVKELLDHGCTQIDQFKDKPLLKADVQGLLGDLYLTFGMYDTALPLLTQAEATLERLKGPGHKDTAAALNTLGKDYLYLGRYAEAEPLYARALAIREKAAGSNALDLATSLNSLALVFDNQGKYREAEPLYQRSLAIREQVLGPVNPEVAVNLNNLAILYVELGKYRTAEPLYLRAIAIREQALGRWHPDVAESLNNLANVYTQEGRFSEAEGLHQRSLGILTRALGPDHPSVAFSLNNLGELYSAQGRYREAEPLYQRSFAIWQKALGPEAPEVALSTNNLGELYAEEGRFGEAEPRFIRALAIIAKAEGADHADLVPSLVDLALLDLRTGQTAAAPALRDRALAICAKAFGPDAAWPTDKEFLLARLEARLGNRDQALHRLARAVGGDYFDLGFATSPDFATLHGEPAFQNLVEGVRKRKALKGPR